jgi:hypothetical protein
MMHAIDDLPALMGTRLAGLRRPPSGKEQNKLFTGNAKGPFSSSLSFDVPPALSVGVTADGILD